MKQRHKASMAVAVALFSLWYMACSQGTTGINPSPTDVVTITDINKFIADADVKAGVRKTPNYVSSVQMSHIRHEKEGVQCATCHHKNGNDDRIKQCAYCHKGAAADETMHSLCINCHVEKKKGPAMCQDCHKAEAE
jgi:hypothetical protein